MGTFNIDVPFKDVVRIVEQFLKENNFLESLACLEKESKIPLNSISNVSGLLSMFKNGSWDEILLLLQDLQVEPKDLIDFYENLVFEMVLEGDSSVAKILLEKVDAFSCLKASDYERYLYLEYLVNKSEKDLSTDKTWLKWLEEKNSKRPKIAMNLISKLEVAPSNRLLTLLRYSLHWQIDKDILPKDTSKYNLFRHSFERKSSSVISLPPEQQTELIIEKCTKIIDLHELDSDESAIECSSYSNPPGDLLALATSKGKVFILDSFSCQLHPELDFQRQEDKILKMKTPILSVCFSHSNKMITAGDLEGNCSVWQVFDGVELKYFSKCHQSGITSIVWNKDDSNLLSCGFDKTIKILGLRSGQVLKQFRGHQSYISKAIYSQDWERIYSVSDDGTIKIWSVKSNSCLFTIELDEDSHSIGDILPMKEINESFIIFVKSNSSLLKLDSKGKISSLFKIPSSSENFKILNIHSSSRGEYLYLSTSHGTLQIFDWKNQNMIKTLQICSDQIIGFSIHPINNSFLIYDTSRKIRFFSL